MRKTWICLLVLVGTRLSGQGIPYGVEFRVNTRTSDIQDSPRITPLAKGGFVVCWRSYNQDGSGNGIYGQVFASDWSRIGAEFRINATTEVDQFWPQIASLSNGGFAVCWNSFGLDSLGGYHSRLCVQVFSPDGEKLGSEFILGTGNVNVGLPCLASFPDGGFVICWSVENWDGSFGGLFYKIFSADPRRVRREPQVISNAGHFPSIRQVAVLSDGGFLVCWVDEGPDPATNGLYGRIFSADGIEKGEGFRIAPRGWFGYNPQIVTIQGGGFVLCWTDLTDTGVGPVMNIRIFSSDGTWKDSEFSIDGWPERYLAALQNGTLAVCWPTWNAYSYLGAISCQMLSPEGEKTGDRMTVHPCETWCHRWVRVTPLPTGGFVLFWVCCQSGPSGEQVFGQAFSPDGAETGGEFRIISQGAEIQYPPTLRDLQVVSDPEGGYVFFWQDNHNPQSWDTDVFVKRFPGSPLLHALQPFALLEPPNDSSIRTLGQNLKWLQPSDQVVCYPWELHYKILIDDDPDFVSPHAIEQDRDTTLILEDLHPGKTYFWKVLARNIAGDSLWSSNTCAFFVRYDATGGIAVEGTESDRPDRFALHPNFPNPFNATTDIRFDMPSSGSVKIAVHDVNGRLVRVLADGSRNEGSYSAGWDGKDQSGNPVPSGIYVCRMEVRSPDGRRFVQSVKMGLVR
jgi:hypothetical protein